MRRFIAMGAVAGLAVLVFAQVRGSDALANLAKALNGAKSMSATYSVQRVGGVAATFKVDLAKPNKARIDTPTQLIVADGNTITTYDKGENTYFKKPETDSDLKALFASDEMTLFGGFFDAGYYSKVQGAKVTGQKVRKGVTFNVVEASMDASGNKTIAYYIDPADKFAKIGEITLIDKTANTKDTVLIMAKEFAVDGALAGTTFAFNAPSGSREITQEEMNAGTWYTTLGEAQAAAKRLNKPIFVDFYADW